MLYLWTHIRTMPVSGALLALMLLGRSVHAGYAPYQSPPATEDYGVKMDLASILRDPPIQQHERLAEALQIIHPIQSGPRCHYQAALKLLNDCKFLEDTSNNAKDDSESNVDQLETVYAARLAVCELLSANADVPPECRVVTASREACFQKQRGYGSWFSHQEQPKDDKLCYPEAPNPKQFKKCMKAIHAQSQSWMSYSNARQNALIMCHASRDVIEKEKNLSFYKDLGEAVSLMASVLEQYNDRVKVWLRDHDALVEKIRTSSEQVLHDMEQGVSTFDSIKSAFRSFTDMMSRAAQSYSKELNESLEKSKRSMEEHRQELREYHMEMTESSLQQASVQRTQLQFNHDAAAAALRLYHQAALETLQSNHDAAMFKVTELASTVDDLQEKVVVSANNLDNINQGLVNVNRTVERLDAATESLPDILYIVTIFGSIFANPQLLVAIMFCLVGVWKVNGKIAGYIIVTGGLSYLLYLVNIPGLLKANLATTTRHSRTFAEHCKTNLYNALMPLALIIFGSGAVCLIFIGLYTCIRSTCLYEYQDDEGKGGILPSIEKPAPSVTPSSRNQRRSKLFRFLHTATQPDRSNQ